MIVKPQALEVRLVLTSEASAQTEEPGIKDPAASQLPTTTITLAWTAPSFAAVKGIVHAPSAKPAMKPESRDALLTAIAKARGWIDDIRLGRIASFAEIAKREDQGERYIRLLAPLAFVSPRIIAAIVDGTAPADLTVTGLARGAAVFVGRAGAEHRAPAIKFFDRTCADRCEPVSVPYRTGLRHAETEIGKWQAETGVAKPPIRDRKSRNCRPETPARQPNPPECRRFSHTRKSHRRDRTGWLGR